MNRFTIHLLLTFLLAPSLLPETAIAQSPQRAAVQSADSKPAPESEPEKEDTMSSENPVVLFVGASGSVGRLAVAEAFRRGYKTKALVRDPAQARLFPEGVQIIVGELTRAETLREAVDGVTGIVFTHGVGGNDAKAAEAVNYGAVRNVLSVLKAPAHIALMTAVGVTKPTVGHDWKRRGERLVRASGLPYTIVRPGWFDYNAPDQLRLVLRQGDTHWAGSPSDGVIARAQIAQVLVGSLTSPAANRKTFELVSEKGSAQSDLEPLFSALPADPANGIDGIRDRDNLSLANEPAVFTDDLEAIRGRFKD
ncbi:SDR family oxidoreductase [Advenella mimigardefordensis]|uniref:NAD(P)-binding Rossmann-fold domain-containing protein n=1 Tax=Advenella mimigardefordensis (strain DSM 17166 / LMG 22922 / DPN7) TaxID=1247726 RepID=W0P9D5_ADVMD|nr:SDR family oxidoreductase [Advenella mimigardefordensis]AHG63464.1 NAD(P)-binding Rossmann-fold domain-containing protein [Advenella mimigardefordensis DPN7]